ncbi:MAG: NADH-quinone oxidoreductase subunit D [Candidatus Hydrogenedentota bacterium]
MQTNSKKTIFLNLGPSHPAMHGTIHFEAEVDGEIIENIKARIGYLHCGFEKQAESMSYHQYIAVTDRMNYLSPLCNNLAYCLSVEKLLEIKAPKKAEVLRIILAELSRIADHMVWLGTHAVDIGAMTPFFYGFQEREKIYDIFVEISGARMTTSFIRIGGVAKDFTSKSYQMIREFTKNHIRVLNDIDTLLTKNKIWINRTRNIGCILREDAINLGITGPALRASGEPRDIRKLEPYSSYEDFEFEIPLAYKGDVYSRYLVRLEEVRQSIKIINQAVNNVPSGKYILDEYNIACPTQNGKNYISSAEELIHHFKLIMDGHGIRPREGEAYVPTEAPNGELGFYIVSDGTDKPYRVRVRPPSFLHINAVPYMSKGHLISDIVGILASMNVIAGEMDR